MTDSIGDLLKSRGNNEPEEIVLIKAFVKQKFNEPAQVTIREFQIIITVQSAALAGALRMQLYNLQQQLDTKKRLVIRIS